MWNDSFGADTKKHVKAQLARFTPLCLPYCKPWFLQVMTSYSALFRENAELACEAYDSIL